MSTSPGACHCAPNVPEFLTLNPNGTVPVVVDNGFVLWESNAIVRYLAETSGSPLWPQDRREGALVDQWLTWQATELLPSRLYAVSARLAQNPAFTDLSKIAESVER